MRDRGARRAAARMLRERRASALLPLDVYTLSSHHTLNTLMNIIPIITLPLVERLRHYAAYLPMMPRLFAVSACPACASAAHVYLRRARYDMSVEARQR